MDNKVRFATWLLYILYVEEVVSFEAGMTIESIGILGDFSWSNGNMYIYRYTQTGAVVATIAMVITMLLIILPLIIMTVRRGRKFLCKKNIVIAIASILIGCALMIPLTRIMEISPAANISHHLYKLVDENVVDLEYKDSLAGIF